MPCIAAWPTAVFELPVSLYFRAACPTAVLLAAAPFMPMSAACPTAVLLLPVILPAPLSNIACWPTAVLLLPVVIHFSAAPPTAVLFVAAPLIFCNALRPTAVLALPVRGVPER